MKSGSARPRRRNFTATGRADFLGRRDRRSPVSRSTRIASTMRSWVFGSAPALPARTLRAGCLGVGGVGIAQSTASARIQCADLERRSHHPGEEAREVRSVGSGTFDAEQRTAPSNLGTVKQTRVASAYSGQRPPETIVFPGFALKADAPSNS